MKEKLCKAFKAVIGVFLAILVALYSLFTMPVLPVYADESSELLAFLSLLWAQASTIAGIPGGTAVASCVFAVAVASQNSIHTGSTISASSISTAGGYYSIGDGNVYFASFLLSGDFDYSGSDGGLIVGEGEHFRFKYLLNGIPTQANLSTQVLGSSYIVMFSGAPGLQVSVLCDKGDFFPAQTSYYTSSGYFDMYYRIYDGSIPTLSSDVTLYFRRSNTPLSLIGDVVTVTLPDGTIDPSSPFTYIENVLRPWVQENYPDAEVLLPESPQEDTTEESTEESTEDTTEETNFTCCEPFTLPPEWLENNAELDTEHYTVPYSDIVKSPWDDLQSYVTYYHDTLLNDAGGGGSGANSVGFFLADTDVIDTIADFQAFAVGLLDRSGLLAVFASLIAVGFIIRFISLH